MTTEFSFLRFPLSKSPWILPLTLFDNLLLTLGRHSHLSGPPMAHQRPSTTLVWESEGDPEKRRTNLSVCALEREAKGAPPKPRFGVLLPHPPRLHRPLTVSAPRTPHSLRVLGAACAKNLVQRHRGLAQELVDAYERAVHSGEHQLAGSG